MTVHFKRMTQFCVIGLGFSMNVIMLTREFRGVIDRLKYVASLTVYVFLNYTGAVSDDGKIRMRGSLLDTDYCI